MKEKHLSYYNLLDAFKTNSCPICHLVENSISKFFENLLYENVNDAEFRKNFIKNEGLCNFHAYELLKYNDSLAVAILSADLLNNKIKTLGQKFTKKLKNNKRCLICEHLIQTEKRYFSLLKTYIEQKDEQLIKTYLSSDGLCIKHFELFLKSTKVLNKSIVEHQLEKYRVFLSLLEKFIDSCDSTKNIVLNEKEKFVWKKAVSLLFGFRGYIS